MRKGEGCYEASIRPCADRHPDGFPNQLTPMRDCLYLVDGGFAINSPFPLSLLPQRSVDLILSFDYSLEAPFEVKLGEKRGRLCQGGLAGCLGIALHGGLGSDLWVTAL